MKEKAKGETNSPEISFDQFKEIVLEDYRLANESRQTSLLGRKEVLTGKAKFGIFGDGKEIAQIAMAKTFRNGDFRSGYYRDQTFMMSAGLLTIQQFFAQLYAHTDVEADPSSAGRLMNGHYATRLIDENGEWKELTAMKNSSADISPTAGQMPRLLGLALASKVYRNNSQLAKDRFRKFSLSGNEVAFGTIGDASTSEGLFFETMNAAGVLQVPMAISVWDDGYGISVPTKLQTTKGNISDALSGLERTKNKPGFVIMKGKGWDYPGLCEMYEEGIRTCREEHVPVLFHITEMTQPQGHSTSGSHERYKSKKRLKWEDEYDCIAKMREWILQSAIATPSELDEIEKNAKQEARNQQKAAWKAYQEDINDDRNSAAEVMSKLELSRSNGVFISKIRESVIEETDIERRVIAAKVKEVFRLTAGEEDPARQELLRWLDQFNERMNDRYHDHLHRRSKYNAMKVEDVGVRYADDARMVDGREVLLENFDALLSRYPEMVAFGEDLGNIGGVNQTWAGMQEKYGEIRIYATGIREATIIGQGIGLALRGLRPVAEIQYLDYLVYALTVITDDLACLQYRTKGGQKAPMIISTRGHRLEGVWHSGSPISMLLGSLRGMYLLVPRNMTQAAAYYNTIMASDEPALIIEPLNGYRLKEKRPANPGEFTLRPGVPEVLQEGEDVTIVTYGSCCRIVMDAAIKLEQLGVSCEVIDVQSLLPFDVDNMILGSLKKTNKIVFVDEDVPGGGTAYMYQQVIEKQGGFDWLEMPPVTLSAQPHRPAYGSDGDYFSKPNTEDVIDTVYDLVQRCNPGLYPPLYK
jgi:pyruvate/2-oxoglutarate/acetoin dehydrogenase E1 component/TPP-dependent pyruvate/acetoin dehydrogenase alpha subunit